MGGEALREGGKKHLSIVASRTEDRNREKRNKNTTKEERKKRTKRKKVHPTDSNVAEKKERGTSWNAAKGGR